MSQLAFIADYALRTHPRNFIAAARLLYSKLEIPPEIEELLGKPLIEEKVKEYLRKFSQERSSEAAKETPERAGGTAPQSLTPTAAGASAASSSDPVTFVTDDFDITEKGASPGGGDHVADDSQAGTVSPAKSSAVTAGAIVALSNVVRRSLLDSFPINKQPIGDVGRDEAEAWLVSHDRDGRFVRMLIQGVPPKGRIRDYVTPEEAERIYRLAEESADV